MFFFTYLSTTRTSEQLNKKWEIGGTLIHRNGQIRENSDCWDKSNASLAQSRVRYHFNNKWDAMAE